MAIEHTPRLGLTKWTDPELLDPVHPDQFNADADALDDLAAIAVQGTAAARPAAGVRGRLYYATDTGDLTYDTGTAWVAVGTAGAAGVFDVTNAPYNAKGDGITDDSASIQAAIQAAADAGGGVVYLPPGIYALGTGLAWRTNVSLVGAGPGVSILRPTADIGGSCIEAGGAPAAPITDCTFRDLEIDGSLVPTTTKSKGIFITYMLRPRFLNLYVHDTTTTGLGCDFLVDAVFDGCVVENCGREAIGSEDTIAGCSGIGIGTGVYETESIIVTNCVVRNNVRFGIFVEYQTGLGSYLSRGVQIVNNYVEGSHWGIGSCGVDQARIVDNTVHSITTHGIHIGKSDASHGALSVGDFVSGNIITDCGGRGINVDATSGDLAGYTVGHYRIDNNTVRNSASVGIKVSASGVVAESRVTGNLVEGCGSLGLDFAGGTLNDMMVDGNTILDNTGDGIRLLADTTRVKVTNNRSGDTRSGASRTQTQGLNVQSTAIDGDISGNDFRNNSSAAVVTGGIGSGTRTLNNVGYQPIGTDTLSITASPMTYTAGASPETLYIIGGTWTSVQLNGTDVFTSDPSVLTLDPYDVVVFTYTSAPTAIKRTRH